MEHNSEDVFIGKLISSNSFNRKKHEIKFIDEEDSIVIDFIDKNRKIVHEIKKSNKFEELHIWQVKYYLYVLDKKGLNGFKGLINYPKQKRYKEINLTEEDKVKIDRVIEDIKRILDLEKPLPVINKPYCKSCSYYEFCYC